LLPLHVFKASLCGNQRHCPHPASPDHALKETNYQFMLLIVAGATMYQQVAAKCAAMKAGLPHSTQGCATHMLTALHAPTPVGPLLPVSCEVLMPSSSELKLSAKL